MFDKLFASIGLLACLVLAVHMCVPRGMQRRMELLPESVLRWLRQRLIWRFNARERRRVAHRITTAAISRARIAANEEHGSWEGNVYRPKQFDRPSKLH